MKTWIIGGVVISAICALVWAFWVDHVMYQSWYAVLVPVGHWIATALAFFLNRRYEKKKRGDC